MRQLPPPPQLSDNQLVAFIFTENRLLREYCRATGFRYSTNAGVVIAMTNGERNKKFIKNKNTHYERI
jgi:hypothetical protein